MVNAGASGTFDIGGELTVNRLGFGAMQLTGEDIIGEPTDPEQARAVLQRAVELDVNFMDTADAYGPCVSERLLGEVLADGADPARNRPTGGDPRTDSEGPPVVDEPRPGTGDVVVATKGGLLRNRDGEWIPRGDPDYLRNAILGSSDRLRTTTIDLYQLHRPDSDVPFEDSVTALAELKDDALVRHIGLSNVSVQQLDVANDIVEIATVQNHYNIAEREHDDVLAACEEMDIGFIPWFPLGAGDLEEPMSVLDDIATRHDATHYQVALAWLLERSPVMLPIPGTANVSHLEENVAAASLDLDESEVTRLNNAS